MNFENCSCEVCPHEIEYSWAKKLPDIIEIKDDPMTWFRLPCLLTWKVPVGKISKIDLIKLYEFYEKEAFDKISSNKI